MFIRDGKTSTVVKLLVGSGGVTKGDLVAVSSGKIVKAAAQATAALGIALESASENDYALVDVAGGRIITAEFTGSGKTSLADTDLGTVFDLSDENTVNLDDTSGGICLCVGYNNEKGTIDFILTEASRIA
jgi:hypothetical protein